jgi:small GTP-binding protein
MQSSRDSAGVYRVVTIGEASVGKTSIISRLVSGTFSPNISSTVGANFQEYRKMVGDRMITLHVWDTAGQERFRALSPIYYRGAHAAVAVFAMDNRDSLEALPEQIDLFLEIAKDAVVFVAGNKADLDDQRTFSESEAEALANERGWRLFFTSAKESKGIRELFDAICAEMSKLKIEKKPAFDPGHYQEESPCC